MWTARRATGRAWLMLAGGFGAALVGACGGTAWRGGASEPTSERGGARGGGGLFAPVATVGASASVAPAACREVTFREIPASPLPPVGTTLGEETETLGTAAGFVVARSGTGPSRAVFWDAASNTWRDVGDGPTTYRTGDVGPMSGGHWMPVGEFAVLVWRNDSQRPGLQGALADRAAGTLTELSLEGGPTSVGLRFVDTAGRLVVFEGPGLADGWRFDPRARVWATITTEGRPAIANDAALVALGDRALVFGPAMAGEGSEGALYDPQTDHWTPIARGPTPAPAFVATSGDALFWWGPAVYTEPVGGAIYDRSLDAWRTVARAGAPDARPTGIPLFAFTGTHLVHAEAHPENHGLAHDPAAICDVAAGAWSRVPIPPTFGDPYALPDGRAVFFGRGSAQPIVLDPRTGLVCTPDVSAVPTLGTSPATLFAFAGVVGDELVLWGRTDSGPTRSACPPGAPCMPTESWSSSRDDGVAVRF